TEPADPSEEWLIAYGGRMYSQWAEVLDQNLPARGQPGGGGYGDAPKAKGPDIWRCATCHGWDYKGVGANKATNLRGLVGGDPARVVKALRNERHRYTPEMIPDGAAMRLGLFLTKGQYDVDKVIDPTTRKINGNPVRGKAAFQNLCASCHGYDGKAQNFAGSKAPEFIGTVARVNPWLLIHTARNGFPGEAMPANFWMGMDILADIGSYAQTLPEK
ncbi:MAG: cytochrome c, partial [Magnetospirillum sp.]|nr:cytochrome c [Magnetospirillum sp.]